MVESYDFLHFFAKMHLAVAILRAKNELAIKDDTVKIYEDFCVRLDNKDRAFFFFTSFLSGKKKAFNQVKAMFGWMK